MHIRRVTCRSSLWLAMLLLVTATSQVQSADHQVSSLTDKNALSRELKAEGVAALAKAARKKGNPVRGAILFPQRMINCTKCHAAGTQKLLGPDLTKMGKEATDVYLVESLLEPSKVIKKGFESVSVITNAGETVSGRIVEQDEKRIVLRDAAESGRLITLAKSNIDEILPSKKSTMPDGLVDQLSNRQQFLDLVKYMMEMVDVRPSIAANQFQHSPGGGQLSDELQGLVLLDDFSCVACHRDVSAINPVSPKQAPDLRWGSGKLNPRYIERFIANPSSVKPGTTMPDMLGRLGADARRDAATAITHFLVSLGSKAFSPKAVDPSAAHRGNELFHSVGCVACHSPRNDAGNERFAESSVPLGKLEEKYNVDGLASLLRDPHAVRPSGRMPNMKLSHFEAQEIAHYLLSNEKTEKKPAKPFELDRTLATKGKQHFIQLQCVQCHKLEGIRSVSKYPSLELVRIDQGCLSGKTGNWPRYRFSDSQRTALRAALGRESKVLTDQEQIAVTLTTFKCVACHQRGDLGGVSADRDDYFHTTNQNLGRQGRLPPTLSGVGAKLKPKWMREVLVMGRTIRPYMKTRMPQYGADNIAHLVNQLQLVDRRPSVKFAKFSDQKEMRKTGLEMVGRNGLNCIACHTYRLKRSQTMAAVDLTEMAQRLHKDWFYRYMRAPQRYSQQTVMPSFWPGGRAMRKDILNGSADQQVEAVWQYLLDGRQAGTPRGLIREPLEIVVGDEAVMLRRNYNGIGKRGIGVGYPNQVNLAFDAEQMRLAMIWKGKFADPGAVWRGQGSGTVRPIGSDLIRFARGPELDDAIEPWPVSDGRPPKHRFKGYYLDSAQRPTFMYRFENIDVEDYLVDLKDEKTGTVRIRRTLTFTSKQARKNLVFRAATNEKIVTAGSGSFRIGNSLRIRITGQLKGEIVDGTTGQQLRIPINLAKGKSTLVLEYSW